MIHTAFYKFVLIDDSDELASRVRELAQGLLGSVLVAEEGINGTLAGDAQAVQAFERELTRDARFASIAFKHSSCTTPPFARLKVHARSEIVSVGLLRALAATGTTRVSPAAWRELIAREDVVVLDNRNAFEYRLGHFKKAVDPKAVNFSDFPAFVQARAEQWKAQRKTVAMYCTGGIRCEKTAGWMQSLGLDVRELDGGILNYFQTLPDAERDWQGECFVFDNRIALDTRLQETATTAEQVYAGEADGQWRIARARRLDEAV